jgi:signal transduction histidine kinase
MRVPRVAQVLQIAPGDAYALAIVSLLAMCFASAAFHLFGGRDRRYIWASTVENTGYAVAFMTLIYRSKPDSFVWLFYVLVASLNGSTNEKRALLRAAIILPPACLSLAYLVLRGDTVGAGTAVVAGGVAVLAFEAQAATAGRLDDATRRYDEAQAQLAKLRFLGERERIARDLHDGIAADLSAIAMRAQRLVGERPEEAAGLRQIAARAADGLDDLRTTVWALSKPECTFVELVDYIRARAGDLATPETSVDVEAKGSDARFTGEEAAHVQRVVDECVRNAVRHARATRVHVSLAADPFRIEVEDDGIGLAPAGLERRSGLRHLETRAAALGGVLELTSGQGALGGLRVVVRRETRRA